jgi:SM-20-related protein
MQFYKEEQYVSWMDALAQNDYVVLDDFLAEENYQELKQFFNGKLEADTLHKAGIGASKDFMVDSRVRGDYVYWIDKERDLPLKSIYTQVEELIYYLKSVCFLSISDIELHLAYYPAGTFYKRHLDQFNERNNRLISFVLYLNDQWKVGDGGELIVYRDEQNIAVEPLGNRLILFKSAEVEHEVSITHAPRMSLTGWMLNNPVGLGFL